MQASLLPHQEEKKNQEAAWWGGETWPKLHAKGE